MKSKTTIILLVILVSLTSCKKQDNDPDKNGDYSPGGVFIINEGNFSSGNSSLTYYNPMDDTAISQVFYRANKVPLGDVAQSMYFYKNRAFISVNNSGTVYCIDPSNGSYLGSVTNLMSPREILVIDDSKAYISDFLSPGITIFNPQTYEITGSIEIGKTTEAMLLHDNKVLVSNWSSYNQTKANNTIMVIDPSTDTFVDSIVVGIEPQSMVIDKGGNLWVLCSGGFSGDENPSLWNINLGDNSLVRKYIFPDILSSPEDLCINSTKDTLYLLNKDVFAMSIEVESIPETGIII